MAWDERRKGRYYYRTRNDADGVHRIYVGSGLVGELAAEQDQSARDLRSQKRQLESAAQERVRSTLKPLVDTCHTTDSLIQAALLSVGFHQHRPAQWRKRRVRHAENT